MKYVVQSFSFQFRESLSLPLREPLSIPFIIFFNQFYK
ncbi:hypothetical protein J5U23_00686 [Saccharolobus shibatae B12]|uniref:Uncharacterized protein n=1 Tax=Saccharolobus shibatae (strain ATCC 51178 / DSM 5389 / JCM 8931 / NBRC 15437 / B12) TaxID=523848 RepID=A0A8F5BMD0_SACSH|nr:hypothetical protein J5U23_00686 [Saccharolobus shibatae B12]